MYLLYFFKIVLLDASVSCHSYAQIWFKNNIIAIKLFLVKTVDFKSVFNLRMISE